MDYDATWGRPIAAFSRAAEDHVFFDSCRMLRFDRRGAVLEDRVVCQDLERVAVAEDGEGYWLAGAQGLTAPNGKKGFELRLSRLDSAGAPRLTRPVRTSGAFESTTLAVSPSHVALTTIMRGDAPYRPLLLVSKSDFEAGTLEAEAIVSDACPRGVDRVRWTERGFEGFCTPSRRIVVSTGGEVVTNVPAPFYTWTSRCLESWSYFPESTVFAEDGPRFVALEGPDPAGSGCNARIGSAPVGTTFAVVTRSEANAQKPQRLTELPQTNDGPLDATLCLSSSREAVVVSRLRNDRVELRRAPYAGGAEPPYVTTLGYWGRAFCPIPIAGGYLLPTEEEVEPGNPLRKKLGIERLACD